MDVISSGVCPVAFSSKMVRVRPLADNFRERALGSIKKKLEV